MLNLISRAKVKQQLGTTDSLYDGQIDAMIPIVSSDVRRILNNSFNKYVLAVFTLGSTDIDFGVINSNFYQEGDYIPSVYDEGQVIYSAGLPDDTYLSSIDPITGIYTLSAAATADGTYVVPTIKISQWPAISKMIWYRIMRMNTDSVGKRKVSAESYGGISKSYAQSELNSQYDYPQILIDDLGPAYAKVG